MWGKLTSSSVLHRVLVAVAIWSSCAVFVPAGTGVIVETRADSYLPTLIRDALDILPSDWNVLVLHGPKVEAALKFGLQHLSSPRLSLVRMEHDMAMSNVEMLTQVWWHVVNGYAMTIQTDGALCRAPGLNSSQVRAGAADVLAQATSFDYIGAQWKDVHSLTTHGQGGNGGYSLRSKAAALDVLRHFPYSSFFSMTFVVATTRKLGRPQHRHSARDGLLSLEEDVYFNMMLPFVGAAAAPPAVADLFAVEAVWDGHTPPMCVHAPWKHLNAPRLAKLLQLCPGAEVPFFAAAAKAFESNSKLFDADEASTRGEATAAGQAIHGPGAFRGRAYQAVLQDQDRVLSAAVAGDNNEKVRVRRPETMVLSSSGAVKG